MVGTSVIKELKTKTLVHFIREYDFQKIDGRGGIIRILPNICDGAFLQK